MRMFLRGLFVVTLLAASANAAIVTYVFAGSVTGESHAGHDFSNVQIGDAFRWEMDVDTAASVLFDFPTVKTYNNPIVAQDLTIGNESSSAALSSSLLNIDLSVRSIDFLAAFPTSGQTGGVIALKYPSGFLTSTDIPLTLDVADTTSIIANIDNWQIAITTITSSNASLVAPEPTSLVPLLLAGLVRLRRR